MSSRRLRQKITVSDDDDGEFQEKSVQANGSDSEEVSEAEFDEDEYDDEEIIPQIEDDEDDEVNSEENYEDVGEAVARRPKRATRPVRETKKRQLTFYEEDDLLESDEDSLPAAPPPKKVKKISVKLKIPRRAAVKKKDDFMEPEQEYKPDVARMTERQRARLMDDDPSERYEDSMFARMDEQLLALNRKTQKKQETAEEIAVRRAENARKRHDYKIRQLEEEKRDTLNKLLKRRATKTRERPDEDTPDTKQTLKPRRPAMSHPALIRWVCSSEGSVLAMTD